MPQTCLECSGELKRGKCSQCGWVSPHKAKPSNIFCPITKCGGVLSDIGQCEQGGGYPITMLCPFVCPFCRSRLNWDGACMWCYGTHSRQDKATWTFPGDYHEAQGGHWIKAELPAKACTQKQNKECLAVVYAVLDKRMTVKDGLEKVGDILSPVPF